MEIIKRSIEEWTDLIKHDLFVIETLQKIDDLYEEYYSIESQQFKSETILNKTKHKIKRLFNKDKFDIDLFIAEKHFEMNKEHAKVNILGEIRRLAQEIFYKKKLKDKSDSEICLQKFQKIFILISGEQDRCFDYANNCVNDACNAKIRSLQGVI